jgi:peptidoglycan/LPS O-acetylase OafA/YrhL
MRYIAALDGLRAVAVALVVAYHAAHVPAGYLGVDIFFVLSGFLITSLLLAEQRRTGRVDIVNFYLRRALRLFPGLWLMIGVVLLYSWTVHLPSRFFFDAFESTFPLLYVENWRVIHQGPPGNIFQHTWSLSVEEQFYLVWAFVAALWLPRLPARRAAVALTLFLLLACVWRVIVWEIDGSWIRVFCGTDTRADELIAGSLVAVLYSVDGIRAKMENSARVLSAVAIASFVGLVLVACLATAEQEAKLFGAQAFATAATAVIIVDLVCNRTGFLTALLSRRLLVYLGSISYGIYLWHDPLSWIAYEWGASPMTRIMVIAGGGIILAAASHRYVESPALALKAKLPRSLAHVA